MFGRLALMLMTTCASAAPALAEEHLVHDQAAYQRVLANIEAGDTIVLANGEWRDFEMVVAGSGMPGSPIRVTAQNAGDVALTGQSNLQISGDYLEVSGLVFRDGYSPTGDVIAFRGSDGVLASNSRVTQVVIDNFSKPDRNETDYWVSIYGQNNRFDHNHLVGKTNRGVTLAVRLDSQQSRQNNHRIDHNYFGPRPVLGSNGGETLRIGTSHYAQYNSNTTVERNVFDRTDGEVEIISSKSGENIIAGNLFLRSRGAVTLRHGDGNLVEGNVFLGHGKDHTGGIRVINARQSVRGNYMEGLRGTGFASALTVMNGVPNSPANRYVQVSDAVIEGNSVLDSRNVSLGTGADEERSAAPTRSVMRGNLFQGIGAENLFQIDADISGIDMVGNVLIGDGQSEVLSSLPAARQATLERGSNGLLYPADDDIGDVGVSRDLQVVALTEVGVPWYAKPDNQGVFDGGRLIRVPADAAGLLAALQGAGDGDTIQLAAGTYAMDRSLIIDKALTFAGPVEGPQAVLRFARPSLFELREGGRLRLRNLEVDGANAPDSVGNAVIRTGRLPIRGNLQIELDAVTVTGLMVNRSFDVINLGPATFADRIAITNSVFQDITGSVVTAAAERDDQGRYNVEYLDIDSSIFRNIRGPVGHIYRGGTDESTFGPHVTLRNSSLENVGAAGGASLLLHGVQITNISDNAFGASGPLRIIHTVGTPITAVKSNSFSSTPAPMVEELIFPGPVRIDAQDNSFDREKGE